MRQRGPWQDNSSGDTIRFDFAAPRHWSEERIHAECSAVIDALVAIRHESVLPPHNWLALARAMPAALRAALILELLAGNRMMGIACSRWSRRAGVVVTLRDRFHPSSRSIAPGLQWRPMERRQDCREELSQTCGSAEYSLIA